MDTSHSSVGVLVISYRSESDFEIGRLHVFKILVAHGITGTAVESEMRLDSQEEMPKSTL